MRLIPFQDFRTSDGATLQYFELGKGQPIILIAGGHTSVQTYRPVVDKLMQNYRVIGFERRFEGRTKAPFSDMTMRKQGQDLKELLDLLTLQEPILIGHSIGSATIMSYLSQYGDNRIKTAIFIDQTPKMINDSTWDAGMPNLTADTIVNFFKHPASPFYKKPNLKTIWLLIVIYLFKQRPRYSIIDKLPIYRNHSLSDWRESLTHIKKPVLFLAAEKSPYWPTKHAELAADMVENGEFELLKNIGHGAYLEDAMQVISVIEEWLGRFR